MKKFMIAAVSSGCGKTTFTMGLLRLLKKRGLAVQPFKCGPDYIDTKWHCMAAGRESVNLDTWMSSDGHVRRLVSHYGAGCDVCVAEGAMGLFDGYDRDKGSCASVAKICDMPVVLLVNAKAMAYSAAPLLYGFSRFDTGIKVAGVIFNQVGSESHYSHLKTACEAAGLRCFGYLRKSKDVELPSRHLGLTIDERYRVDAFIERVSALVEATVDVDTMLDSVADSPASEVETPDFRGGVNRLFSALGCRPKCVAVAHDEAFNFVYRANMDALRSVSEVRLFSPLRDAEVSEGIDFIYFPGGYPEFFLESLSANKSMLSSVRRYVDNGGYAYAECGGMLYLCNAVKGMDEKVYDLAGAFDMNGTFDNMRLHLGYRRVRLCDSDGLPVEMRGHEFHYSDICGCKAVSAGWSQYDARGKEVSTSVFRHNNTFAGYTHLYWAE